jgi:hypothetical protein
VTVDDVALGHVVDAPERIQNLVARHHLAGLGRQEVEQALLEPGQVQRRCPGPYLLHDVNLELSERQDRVERDRAAEGAAGGDQHTGQQLLGRKRDRHDVVSTLLEGCELGPEIPSAC